VSSVSYAPLRCVPVRAREVGHSVPQSFPQSLRAPPPDPLHRIRKAYLTSASVATIRSSPLCAVSRMSEPENSCATEAVEWSVPLHVGAIFIILAASFLGVATTLIGDTFPKLKVNEYVLGLLKTFGTGIVLSCGMIHMLLPAAESLANPCLPQSVFGEDGYPAYAYAISLAAVLFMQQLEMHLSSRWRPHTGPADSSETGASAPLVAKPPGNATTVLVDAFSAEFSLTVHSIFVGLAVGVVSDEELTSLLVALVFHQFFEGIALGARLCKAPMSLAFRYFLAFVFAIAAPVGQAAGVGVMAGSILNTAGETFLLVQGIFDSLCAGLLLHVGFSLLLKDLPEDVEKLVSMGELENSPSSGAPSKRAGTCKRISMYAALWTGAVLMAVIGKYL
jgi:zinc transporter 1/2/3